MRTLSAFFLALVVFVGITSCDNEEKKSDTAILKTSVGKTSEVLVVTDNKLWKSEVGDSVRNVLGEIKPWLFQAEPYFDIVHVTPDAFKDVVYKKFRNILIIKIDKNFEKNMYKGRRNVYSKPQVIFDINCKSKDDFARIFSEISKDITDKFHQNELTRLKGFFKSIKVDSLTDFVNEKFGFKMIFPKGYYVAKQVADFAWIREVTPEIEEGFLIYTQPYSDTMQLKPANIIMYRNELTKSFIQGPVDSSYMKVSSVFPYYSETTSFKGNYATLIRSWWDTHGYALGGPFLSYTFVDTVASRLITIDGYIKAPKKDKRDLLLHLEAIMDSFEME